MEVYKDKAKKKGASKGKSNPAGKGKGKKLPARSMQKKTGQLRPEFGNASKIWKPFGM